MRAATHALRRAAVAWAIAMSLASPAVARPFTVEDLLGLEGFGPVSVDPTGHWLVLERRDPYVKTPAFDYSTRNDVAGSRLRLVDLYRPAQARPLIPNSDGPGDIAVAFSPDGARLAIYRLQNHRLELGVVVVATGEVRWLGVSPEEPYTNRAVQWRSPTELVAIARPDGDLPLFYRMSSQAAALLPGRWATTAAGGVAKTVLTSGETPALRPRPAPRSLVLINVLNGQRRTLAEGEITDLEIAPGGSHVAVLMSGADIQPRADAPLQGIWGLQTERHNLTILEIATGKQIPVDREADLLDSFICWRPDGHEVLVFARSPNTPWTAGRFLRVAVASGAVTPVQSPGLFPEIHVRPEGVYAAWMGVDPVLLAHPAGGPQAARLDWYRLAGGKPINLTRALTAVPRHLDNIEPDSVHLIADGRAWRLDAKGAVLGRPLTGVDPTPFPRLERARRSAEDVTGREAIFWRPQKAHPQMVPAEAGAAPIDLPLGATPLAYAPRSGAAVLDRRAATGLEEILVARAGAAPIVVETINVRLADTPPARLVAIDTPGPQGETVRSWLYLPPDSGSGAPPPLVVRPYLGERNPVPYPEYPPPLGLTANIRTLVGHGYAVLLPSLPRAPNAEPLEGLADRVLAIVDAVGARPDLTQAYDHQRLALWGHSYGGYSVLGILTQTQRFGAAVASSPPTNLISIWGTFQPSWRVAPEDGLWMAWPAGWTETAQGGMGGPPWADPDRYVRNSPALLADRIQTPVLLLHGDQDPIGLSQSEQMFSALYRQNKPAELVTYWGEEHGLSSPGTVRDIYARGFGWIDGHLGWTP
jgi:dipeptidyl aminopeptidase/acylaminoacyl peptidase